MTGQEIAIEVRRIIARVAPDVDPRTIRPEEDIRRTLGIDSFDHLRILTAINERFLIDIPETDHGRLRTLDGMVAYIAECTGSRP